MISWMLALPVLESRRTFSAGSRCFGKSLGTTPRNERGVEIDTLEEGIDSDGGGGGGGEGSLGAFTGDAEATRVGGKVHLVLALELLDEVVDEPVFQVLTTKVGVFLFRHRGRRKFPKARRRWGLFEQNLRWVCRRSMRRRLSLCTLGVYFTNPLVLLTADLLS